MVDDTIDPGVEPAEPAVEPSSAEVSSPTTDEEPAEPEPVLSLVPERLLGHELDATFLGTKVHADLYLTNAFRLLAIPATTAGPDLERRIQRLRQMSRLSPARALKSAAPLGYEQYADIGDPASSVSRLSDPRVRILHEIFWPHMGPEQGAWPDPEGFAEFANAGGQGPDAAIVTQHALAVAHHNRAIAHEIDVAYGRADWEEGHWLRALVLWQGTVASEAFWDYVAARVKAFDDPRLRLEDVDRIRDDLPRIILAINGLFTRLYANAGSGPLTAGHVRLVQNAPFADDLRRATLNEAVEDLARFRVGPWTHQVDTYINAGDKKYPRKEFNNQLGPRIQGVADLAAWLSQGLRIDLSSLELTCFDEFVLAAKKALDSHVDYGTDDNRRAILYSSLIMKRLLAFPITATARHKLEEGLASDRRILYRGHLGAEDHDPTECFFMPGEPADPDASLLEPMWKITRRTVKVDPIAETAGISVGYDVFRVLVPRCRTAAQVHRETAQEGNFGSEDDDGDGEEEVSNSCMMTGCGSIVAAGALVLFCAGQAGWGTVVLLLAIAVFIGSGIVHLLEKRKKRLEFEEEERLERELAAQKKAEEAAAGPKPPTPPKPKVRRHKHASQFPVFSKAKQDGYKRGKEPPDSEMRMTESEREEARMKLLLGRFGS